MHDLKTQLEKLLADAADCELIGNLAADVSKRAAFKRLGEQYREMAARIAAEIERQDRRQKCDRRQDAERPQAQPGTVATLERNS
jgi:hypothetical protein